MKFKLLILILLFSFVAQAQTDIVGYYVFYRYNYGVRQVRARADSIQGIPLLRATGADNGSIAIERDTFYWKSSGLWRTFYKNYRYSVYDSLGYVGLLNDLSAPGYLKYYGTNLSGTKGWFALPTEKDSLANIRIDSIVTNWNTAVNNTNIGSGYRWIKPSQEIRTAIAGFGVDIDSTTNDSSLIFKLDTVVLKTFIDTVKVTGAVTYVGATASGALDFTGSPVTSNGTFVLGWTGDSTQVVRGDGSLATPTDTYVNAATYTGTTLTLTRTDGGTVTTTINTSSGSVTSIGLSMPSAFSVANSPVTSAGTFSVTGAGTVTQTIAGNGTLVNNKGLSALSFGSNTLSATLVSGETVTTTIAGGGTDTLRRDLTLEFATGSENFGWFYSTRQMTIHNIAYAVKGSAAPSITFNIAYSDDRNDLNKVNIFSGDLLCNSYVIATKNPTSNPTDFSVTTIPPFKWVFITSSAATGTINNFNLHLDAY
jgi:hypothetical protein